MEAKDKAKELVDKFTVVGLQQRNEGIQCALIAVDELLEYEKMLVEQIKNHVEIFKGMKFKTENLFWESVKQEIIKL